MGSSHCRVQTLMATFVDLFLYNSDLTYWSFELRDSTVTDILEGQLEITPWCCATLFWGEGNTYLFTSDRELMAMLSKSSFVRQGASLDCLEE